MLDAARTSCPEKNTVDLVIVKIPALAHINLDQSWQIT